MQLPGALPIERRTIKVPDTDKALRWSLGSPESGEIWASRWKAKQARLPLVDWENFRQDKILMEGLDTRTDIFPSYLATNILEGIPMSFCEDIGIGNPLGHYIDGKFYTADSLRYGRSLYKIKEYLSAKGPTKPMKVMEIGCGYGGLAFSFTKQYTVASYTLVDVDICSTIQKKYHALCDSTVPFKYVNYKNESDAEHIDDCDLVIAINSLGEMIQEEINKYFGLIKDKLKLNGIFYSCNMEGKKFIYPYGDTFDFKSISVWGPSLVERIATKIK